MDEDLKRLESKLDSVVEKIGDINVTLAAQHVTLEDHIARTELLEKRIPPLESTNSILGFVFKIILALLGSGIFLGLLKFLVSKL